MNAEEILRIPVNQPELLFNRLLVKKEYRELARFWHPDISKDSQSSKVFAHIGILYTEALKKLKEDSWIIPGIKEFVSVSGTRYRVKYRYNQKFELGNIYVSDTVLIYEIENQYEDLFKSGVKFIKSFVFPNPTMESKMKMLLPNIKQEFKTSTHSVLVLSKTVDLVPLRCFHTYSKKNIDPKHVAWVISRLHNFLCYFQWASIYHNDISIDNCLVSLEHHSLVLTGGWWYAKRQGEKIKKVSKRTYSFMTQEMKDTKKPNSNLDFELVRSIGRELLGDETGTTLLMNKSIPKVVLNWLKLPQTGDAYKDFDIWQNKVLVKAWGKREFIKLDVPIEDIYNVTNGG